LVSGILEAVTANETASYIGTDQVENELTVEPTANYFVGRARRQIQGGRTRFGIITSAVNRSPGPLSDRLHSSAYSGGIDFAHESGNRTWLFSGLFSGSRVSGAPEAIARTQRSSSRYYQRPDASHVELDPAATSLAGFHAMGHVEKQTGNFTMWTGLAAVSPGYEVNDIGFQRTADRVFLDTRLRYSQPDPGRFLRSWYVNVGGPDATWNFAGDLTSLNLNASARLQFLNYWSLWVRARHDPWTDDDRLTRGGPIARSPSYTSWAANLRSDTRKAATARAYFTWGSDEAGGWDRRLRLNLSARLSEAVQLDIGPAYSWSHSAAQYVTRRTDALAQATYGTRYVFAGLDRTTLSLETRLDLTVSPTLSLQLYLEPFVSTGDYGAPREFRQPGTFDFLEYGRDIGTSVLSPAGYYDIDPDGAGPAAGFQVSDRDFSYRSLLGNAVLRWEWRPGSTVFLVWQHRRINSLGAGGTEPWVGTFDLGRDVADIFTSPADNIFMIKVNYWLNP